MRDDTIADKILVELNELLHKQTYVTVPHELRSLGIEDQLLCQALDDLCRMGLILWHRTGSDKSAGFAKITPLGAQQVEGRNAC